MWNKYNFGFIFIKNFLKRISQINWIISHFFISFHWLKCVWVVMERVRGRRGRVFNSHAQYKIAPPEALHVRADVPHVYFRYARNCTLLVNQTGTACKQVIKGRGTMAALTLPHQYVDLSWSVTRSVISIDCLTAGAIIKIYL